MTNYRTTFVTVLCAGGLLTGLEAADPVRIFRLETKSGVKVQVNCRDGKATQAWVLAGNTDYRVDSSADVTGLALNGANLAGTLKLRLAPEPDDQGRVATNATDTEVTLSARDWTAKEVAWGTNAPPPAESTVLELELTLEQEPTAKKKGSFLGHFPLRLQVYVRGERVTGCFGRHPQNNLPVTLNTASLRMKGGELVGKAYLLSYNDHNPETEGVIELSVKCEDAKVSGRFKVEQPAARACAGIVRGQAVTTGELQARCGSYTPGSDWPKFHGPFGNGRAVPCGKPLIEKWDEARLLWKSEDWVWLSTSDHSLFTGTCFNGPIVAAGRVIHHNTEQNCRGPYWEKQVHGVGRDEGSKPRFMGTWLQPALPWSQKEIKDKFLSAFFDDVVRAMDARTGANLWTTRMLDSGFSQAQNSHLTGGLFSHPVATADRVYINGLGGRVWCLDAATGLVLWEREVNPKLAEVLQQAMDNGRRGQLDIWMKNPFGNGKMDVTRNVQYNNALCEGVFLCADVLDGAYGLDAETGAVLWSAPRIADRLGPVLWGKDGTNYVVWAECREVKTGKQTWKWRYLGAKTDWMAAPAEGDCFLTNGEKDSGAAWNQLSTSGMQSLWTSPTNRATKHYAPALAHGFAVIGKQFGTVVIELATGKERELTAGYGEAGGAGDSAMGVGMMVTDNRLLTNAGRGLFACGPRLEDWKRLDPKLLGVSYAICTSAALADGRLFIRSTDGILCYDLRKEK